MTIRTTEPNWIILNDAAHKIDKSWSSTEIQDFMILKTVVTKDQFWNQVNIPNVLRRRLDYEITDYSWDIFEISDHCLDKLIEEYQNDLKNPTGLTYWICGDAAISTIDSQWTEKKLIEILLDRKLIIKIKTPFLYESLHEKIKIAEFRGVFQRITIQIDFIPTLLIEYENYIEDYLREGAILARTPLTDENIEDFIL